MLNLNFTSASAHVLWDAHRVYKIIGILLLVIFYGCYFIKMISQHKKGIKTDQIGKGKTGVVKVIEMTLKISTYLVPVTEFISIVLETTMFPAWARMFGAGIGMAGVIIFVISVITMRDSWRAGVSKTDHTKLVTNGIYQISRNPAFLGFDLVYIGILLMFCNWVLLAVSIFAMLMLHLQIVNVEEDFLISEFGDDYVEYMKKVCRYIGRKS